MEALNNEETMEYCPEMCMSWEARVDTIKGAMEMLDEEEEKPRKERVRPNLKGTSICLKDVQTKVKGDRVPGVCRILQDFAG